jgi:hypothetical protein
MGQSFLCKSFSSKINKTRRKNEEINNTPSTSMDYEKHFGSQDSHSSGSQRLPCILCPGKSFKVIIRLNLRNICIKLLSWDDSLASFNEDVAEELEEKKTSFTISRTFFPLSNQETFL